MEINSKKQQKTHVFLVDTFKGLIGLSLALLSFVLLIVMPFALFTLGIANILDGEWLSGGMYLVSIVASFYAGLGLTELLKGPDTNQTSL